MQPTFYKKQQFLGSATTNFVVEFASRRGEKMKFCDKLLKLRKMNNMSQEQIADKLGISRQAVSKWESGLSIPDMEKMMQLCKILNCNLDELVDDGVGTTTKPASDLKMSFDYYYKEVIDFITKTINMFWSMRLFEKIKCLLEMFFLALILYLAWGILANIINSCFTPLLILLPDGLYQIIHSISNFIYQILGLVAGFVLLVHIFKIRYLDYFITIEDQNTKEKIIETPIEEIKKPSEEPKKNYLIPEKDKVIIRDPKHSTYSFFGILAKLVILFIKFLLIFLALPCIIGFIFLVFAEVLSLWYLKNGSFFLGIALAVAGCIVICYLILKVIYNFILELKCKFSQVFIWFIVGLALIGIGSGVSFGSYITFDKVTIADGEYTATTEEITYEEGLILSFINQSNVKLVENPKALNIAIEIKHKKSVTPHLYLRGHYLSGEKSFYTYDLNFSYHDNGIDQFNDVITMLKDKKRFDSEADYYYQIIITTTPEIIQKLKTNYENRYY